MRPKPQLVQAISIAIADVAVVAIFAVSIFWSKTHRDAAEDGGVHVPHVGHKYHTADQGAQLHVPLMGIAVDKQGGRGTGLSF